MAVELAATEQGAAQEAEAISWLQERYSLEAREKEVRELRSELR